MGHTQNLQFWSIFGPNLPPENPKGCQKLNFFQNLNPYEYQITQVPDPR